MGTRAALLLVAVLGAAWAYTVLRHPRGSAATAQAAPTLAIRTPNGDEKTLSDLKGKVVLVDFWATWCPPCRASMPHIQGMYERYRGQGFAVLGVSLDTDNASITQFTEENGITYTVGQPISASSVTDWNASAIPAMALVDRQGTIRWTQSGFGEGSEREIAEQIEALLRE